MQERKLNDPGKIINQSMILRTEPRPAVWDNPGYFLLPAVCLSGAGCTRHCKCSTELSETEVVGRSSVGQEMSSRSGNLQNNSVSFVSAMYCNKNIDS